MSAVAATPGKPRELESRFAELVRTWKQDRGVSSSSRELAKHPAYLAIIDMGSDVIPLILAELERTPDHWFIALRTLTGVDPVPSEHRGQLSLMAADWVAWGKANGYR